MLTTRPLEATDITQRAVKESRPVVVAVGGDGTLNEVVNGFFHNGAPIPTTSKLAMVPLGSGGDFRRTMRISRDAKEAIDVIRHGLVRRIDAGAVTYQANDGSTATRHFINIADAGLPGDVVHRVNQGSKRLGSLTYTLGGGGRFSQGGQIAEPAIPDAGPPLPRLPGEVGEADRRLGIAPRLAACILDPRAPNRVVHGLDEIIRTRMLMIAAGYEDGNDADRLRGDPS